MFQTKRKTQIFFKRAVISSAREKYEENICFRQKDKLKFFFKGLSSVVLGQTLTEGQTHEKFENANKRLDIWTEKRGSKLMFIKLKNV